MEFFIGFVKPTDPTRKGRPAIVIAREGDYGLAVPCTSAAQRNERIPPGCCAVPSGSRAVAPTKPAGERLRTQGTAVQINQAQWVRMIDLGEPVARLRPERDPVLQRALDAALRAVPRERLNQLQMELNLLIEQDSDCSTGSGI